MKYVQILAGTVAFVAAAVLLVKMRTQEHLWVYVVLFLLCGSNLLSRFTEMSMNDQIADAEEKVAKRVLRRLAKCMPSLLDEYFKAQMTKSEEKLSGVVVSPLVADAVVPFGTMLASASGAAKLEEKPGDVIATRELVSIKGNTKTFVYTEPQAAKIEAASCSCLLREVDPDCAEHGMHALCR